MPVPEARLLAWSDQSAEHAIGRQQSGVRDGQVEAVAEETIGRRPKFGRRPVQLTR
jgi:hypothetical protein